MNPEQNFRGMSAEERQEIPLVFKEITQDDAQRYSEYRAKVIAAYPEEYGVHFEENTDKENVLEEIKSLKDGQKLFLALEGETLVGVAGIDALSQNTNTQRVEGARDAEVATFSVHPDYLRRGVGESMLRKLVEYAQDQGLQQLFLYVRTDNDKAKKLYEKAGFLATGETSISAQDGKTFFEEYVLNI
jgi:ribosomal protein S18 acetylase RimI-like enzyme